MKSTALETTLARIDQLTATSTKKLESLETRLSKLHGQMTFVHQKTETLTVRRTNIEAVLREMEVVLQKFQVASKEQQTIKRGVALPGDLRQFLVAVDQIVDANNFFKLNKTIRSAHKAIDQLTQLENFAEQQLASGFREITAQYSTPQDLHSFPAGFTRESIMRLTELFSGLSTLNRREFLDIFISERRRVISLSLETLGPKLLLGGTGLGAAIGVKSAADKAAGGVAGVVGFLSQRDSPAIEFVQHVPNFVGLIKAEHQMCRTVMSSNSTLGMFTFLKIVKPAFELCMQTVQHIIQSSTGAEKTFICLKVMESPWMNTDDLVDMFRQTTGRELGKQRRFNSIPEAADETQQNSSHMLGLVENLRGMLDDTLVASFHELQQAIESHTQKTSPTSPTVHQLTTNVLQFLKSLTGHRFTLAKVFGSTVKFPERAWCVKLLEALLRNLTQKATTFKSAREGTIFTVNNQHRVLTWLRQTFVENDTMATVVGDEFIQDLGAKLETAIGDYLQSIFGRCLESLLDKNTSIALDKQLSKADRQKIKDRFSGFNSAFDEAFEAQRVTVVPDAHLRDELRTRCKSFIVPIYQDFLHRYSRVPFTKNLNKYMKYPVETAESMIGSYFDESDPNL